MIGHGDGGQTRDFTFVEDAVRANLLAAAAPAVACDSALLDQDFCRLASDEQVNLCEAYSGQVLLVVNTASVGQHPTQASQPRAHAARSI